VVKGLIFEGSRIEDLGWMLLTVDVSMVD